jgi:hypothetical protein
MIGVDEGVAAGEYALGEGIGIPNDEIAEMCKILAKQAAKALDEALWWVRATQYAIKAGKKEDAITNAKAARAVAEKLVDARNRAMPYGYDGDVVSWALSEHLDWIDSMTVEDIAASAYRNAGLKWEDLENIKGIVLSDGYYDERMVKIVDIE